MANVQQVYWVFPPPGVVVNMNTPPQTQTIITVAKPPFTPNLLINTFNLALTEAVAVTNNRWAANGLVIDWGHARVQVNMTYPPNVTLSTGFFNLANALLIFQEIIDGIASWDELVFRAAPQVTYDITLQFQHSRIVQRYNLRPRIRVQGGVLDRANVFGRGGRLRGPNARFGSKYTDMKKKMIHNRDIGSFFRLTDSIMDVPGNNVIFFVFSWVTFCLKERPTTSAFPWLS